jgi:hypothetical protein
LSSISVRRSGALRRLLASSASAFQRSVKGLIGSVTAARGATDHAAESELGCAPKPRSPVETGLPSPKKNEDGPR